MEALPTLARLATASTLKPAQPVSPNRVIAASATRRSTSGSRGRPACAGLVVTLPPPRGSPGLISRSRSEYAGRREKVQYAALWRGSPAASVTRYEMLVPALEIGRAHV